MDLLEAAPAKDRTLYWDTGYEEAVRRGPWKWLRTKSTPNAFLQITPTPAGEFLYILEDDPGETRDVISKNPDIARFSAAAFEEWKRAVEK